MEDIPVTKHSLRIMRHKLHVLYAAVVVAVTADVDAEDDINGDDVGLKQYCSD